MVLVDLGFHRLLVIIATIFAIDMVTLDIDNARTLTKLTTEALCNLIFIEAGSPIVLLHFRETAALSPRLRDGTISILIFLIDKLDLGLEVFV